MHVRMRVWGGMGDGMMSMCSEWNSPLILADNLWPFAVSLYSGMQHLSTLRPPENNRCF